MVSLRIGKTARTTKRAYTRKSKVRSRAYIRAVPTNKVVRFDMGNLKKDFPVRVDLISKQKLQLRHNAIESARMVVNRHLVSFIGSTSDFFFKIRAHPHQVLRENKMLTGAGADRMQTGMAHSFGKAMGVAARLKKGSIVFSVGVDKGNEGKAMEALAFAKSRMPGTYSIVVNK